MQEIHQFPHFDFLACTGANVSQIKEDQVLLNNAINPAFALSDLVSITAGGNQNSAFSSVVRWCVYGRILGFCDEALSSASATVQNDVDGPIHDLFQTINNVVVPNHARVVVLAYPRVWSATSNTCPTDSWFLSEVPMATRLQINDLIDAMNVKLQVQARQAGFIWVDTNDAWDEHRLCDNTPSPWFQYLLAPKEATALLEVDPTTVEDDDDRLGDFYNHGVFHPTAEGHQVLMQGFEAGAGCLGHTLAGST